MFMGWDEMKRTREPDGRNGRSFVYLSFSYLQWIKKFTFG